MNWNFQDLLSLFEKEEYRSAFAEAQYGLEKESLRTDKNGNLAQTPHPEAYGDKLTHPFITTDFSESQIESITPPGKSIHEVYHFLEQNHAYLYEHIGDEFLWPLSMPSHLPEGKEIPIARYGDSEEAKIKETYRRGIGLRYGKKMQLICGVHYNFSFSEKLWDILYEHFGEGKSRQEFISDSYLAVTRNFLRYRWLLVYLFGASPVADESYRENVEKLYDNCGNADNICLKNSTSLRMSRYGYSNTRERGFLVSYNSLHDYIADMRKGLTTSRKSYEEIGLEKDGQKLQLNDSLLQIENEYYSPVRIKQIPKKGETLLEALEERGVDYIEVRAFDINPFTPMGVEKCELHFVHVFLLYCLLKPSPALEQPERFVVNKNQSSTALYGRKAGLMLQDGERKISIPEWGKEILEEMKPIAQLLSSAVASESFVKSVEDQEKKLNDVSLLPSARIVKEMSRCCESFMSFGMNKAREYKKYFLELEKDEAIQKQLRP